MGRVNRGGTDMDEPSWHPASNSVGQENRWNIGDRRAESGSRYHRKECMTLRCQGSCEDQHRRVSYLLVTTACRRSLADRLHSLRHVSQRALWTRLG